MTSKTPISRRALLASVGMAGVFLASEGILSGRKLEKAFGDYGSVTGSVYDREKEKKASIENADWYNVKVYGARGNAVLDTEGNITSGDDDTEAIQRAIEAISPQGGTLYFPKGVYRCNSWIYVTRKTNLSIIGASGATLVFTGNSTYSLGDRVGIWIDKCSNFSIQTLILTSTVNSGGHLYTDANKLTGTVEANGSILHFDDVNDYIIRDIDIPFHNGFGIVITKSRNGTITGSIIKKTWRDGIHLQDGVENATVFGNYVEETGDDGISVFSSGAENSSEKDISKNIVFACNVVKNSWNRGIWGTGDNVLISGNVIDGTAVGGIYSQSEYWTGAATKLARKVTITNNTIKNVGTVASHFRNRTDMYKGIFVETQNQSNTSRVTDLLIEGNLITDFVGVSDKESRGIQAFQVKDAVIKNNVIHSYTREAITVSLSEHVTIADNHLVSPYGNDRSTAIYCETVGDLRVLGNVIDGGTATGINAYNSTEVDIHANTVSNINPRALDGKNGIVASKCDGVKITGNRVDRFGKLERSIKLADITGSLAVHGNIVPHKDFANYQFADAVTTLSNNVKGTTKVLSYDLLVTAAPTAGTWQRGTLLYSALPNETGSAGSKYILSGWVCIAGGTPGTWKELRTPTGN